MKEILRYIDLNKIETFDPLKSNYEYELESSLSIKTVAILSIEKLEKSENNNDITIALRGVTKNRDFKNYKLGELFIVGEKSKYYFSENSRELYMGDANNKEKLINSINKLIDKLNEIIKERGNIHPIKGKVPYVKKTQNINELRIEKLIYLSALHNIGARWRDKNSSPFMSVTYGENKLNTALKFCKCKTEEDIGFVFIYFIPQNNKYFIKTEKLNLLMKKIGVTWYDDIHKEIMMIDGILPHYLFGILEIIDKNRHGLIINPWLYNQYKMKIKFLPKEGILIDQTDFEKYARNMGYKKFYCQSGFKRKQYSIDNDLLDECPEFGDYSI